LVFDHTIIRLLITCHRVRQRGDLLLKMEMEILRRYASQNDTLLSCRSGFLPR